MASPRQKDTLFTTKNSGRENLPLPTQKNARYGMEKKPPTNKKGKQTKKRTKRLIEEETLTGGSLNMFARQGHLYLSVYSHFTLLKYKSQGTETFSPIRSNPAKF